MSGIGATGRKQTGPLAEAVAASTPGDNEPTPDEIVASLAGKSGPESDGIGGDGVGPEWSFNLDHTDSRGRIWTGEFKAHVLTTRDRMTVGLTKARLSMGVPYDLLDPVTRNLLEVLAHLEVCLDARPPWAGDLTAIYDQGVLGAMYEEVVKYEARFHGPGTPEAG